MFGDRLKEVRTQAGLSQKSLAEQLYVTQQSVWKWEMNTSSPNPETIAKIAEIFDVSTDYLLGRTDQKETPTPGDGGGLSDKDTRLIEWFHSLPPEKRKAILMLGEAPGGLDE